MKDHAAQLVRPGSHVRCVDVDETVVVVLEPYSPPNGVAFVPASMEALAFIVPVTYPDAAPDTTGFYVKPASILLSANSQSPTSTSEASILGEPWRKFSWSSKIFPWNPGVDTLETFLATIDGRFRRGN